MIELHHETTFRLQIRGPLTSTAGSPLGERRYYEMSAGELSGGRIRAKIALPGGDWYRPGSDGFGRPDVRVPFITDDNQVVLLHYTGLVQATPAFKRAAETGGETRFDEQYMRMAMHFETGAEQYAWLNESLFLAEGRIAGLNQIEYEIYRVA